MSTSFFKIQQLYRKCRFLVFIMLMLLISSLFMAFTRRARVLPLLAAAIIFHFFLLRPCQKQYSRAFSIENLQRTLCKFLGTDEISEKNGHLITVTTLEASSLMPCKDGKNLPLMRWEIHGKKNGLSIALCDTAIPQVFKLSSKGKKRIHFNNGVWVHIELPSDSQKHYKLLDEVSVPTPIRMEYFSNYTDLETASISDTSIGKRFVLYRPKNTDQQPSAVTLRKLKSLMEYTPGYIALSVDGNQIDVFIRGRFLTRSISLSEKPTEGLLNFNPLPELPYIVNLALSII